MTTSEILALADELEKLCCAETEGKFFDCVTDNIQTILSALRIAAPPVSEHLGARDASVFIPGTEILDRERIIAKYRAIPTKEAQLIALCVTQFNAVTPTTGAGMPTREEIESAIKNKIRIANGFEFKFIEGMDEAADAILALLAARSGG